MAKALIGTGLMAFTMMVTRIEAFSQYYVSIHDIGTSNSFHRQQASRLHLSSTGTDLNLDTTRRIPQFASPDTMTPEKLRQTNTYREGLITVAGITLLFASNSPALHAAYVQVTQTPPVLLLNAAASAVAMVGVLLGGPIMSTQIQGQPLDSSKIDKQNQDSDDPLSLLLGNSNVPLRAGIELGLWKFLGTTANMYGLSETSADHGAFLIQLTTLLVPLAQGLMGVPIPTRIWSAIAMALTGVALFTQDAAGGSVTSMEGDALCALAAVFYATYDLRLFKWGKLVAPLELMTTKIATQTALSTLCLVALGGVGPSMTFLTTASVHDLWLVGMVALWSGLLVNFVAPYLQVGGQQAVGPARAQIVYASQPLWAALMSMLLLGETVGEKGMLGGAAFLGAMLLAATAAVPDPDCKVKICEV
jgi:drug/metabolite transporter (DMT)-like permease